MRGEPYCMLSLSPEGTKCVSLPRNVSSSATQPGGECGVDCPHFALIVWYMRVVTLSKPFARKFPEIIAKIKKPPPLIRPSVSKGAAPPEAINIMRQCWAETPDMRPDFNT